MTGGWAFAVMVLVGVVAVGWVVVDLVRAYRDSWSVRGGRDGRG
jgi:hypothetical protein